MKKLLVLALILLFPATSFAIPIARVNQGTSGLGNTCQVGSGGTQVICTLSQAPLPGDTLVLYNSYADGTVTGTSVTGGGVTWTLAGRSNTNALTEIWYGTNSTGVGTSITVNLTGTVNLTVRTTITEFSGVAFYGALDKGGTGSNGAASPITTASLTPVARLNEVVVASYKGAAVSTGPTNSFTSLNTLNTSFQPVYLLVPNTSGSYSTGWTSSAGPWDSEIATFKGATPSSDMMRMSMGF